MRIAPERIEDAAKELYVRALKDLPPDIKRGFATLAARETGATAKAVLGTMIENIAVAERTGNLLCQDTGIPIYNVTIGRDAEVDGVALKAAIRRGCERATREYPLRSSIVHPLTRKNEHTSCGIGVPVIHVDFSDAFAGLRIEMIPKGSGSENNSWLRMAIPAEGIDAIKTFVVDCVLGAGGKTCPPTIVGVGVGGTADLCVHLAKVAATRPLGSQLRGSRRRRAGGPALRGGEPARRRTAGARRRRDGLRRARRARGDSHHDEPGGGEHAVPFGAALERRADRRRHRVRLLTAMAHHDFTMPVTEAQVRALAVDDTVTLNGTLFGIRDATQIALFDRGRSTRFDLRGACRHPHGAQREESGAVAGAPRRATRPICVGTTTSARMERFTRPLMAQCGVRIVIGKGGLGAESAAAFRELGGVYLAIVGGAAALETTWIEAIEDVDLDDLNPESLWKFRVRGFGPLRVAMDSRGGNLYAAVDAGAKANRAAALAALGVGSGSPPRS